MKRKKKKAREEREKVQGRIERGEKKQQLLGVTKKEKGEKGRKRVCEDRKYMVKRKKASKQARGETNKGHDR